MLESAQNSPWVSLYGEMPQMLSPRRESVLALFRDSLAADPDAIASIYLGRTLTYADLDRDSEALARWLVRDGAMPGDRVAVMLQNEPQNIVAMLAAWKAGCVPVPINPMYRTGELGKLFADCLPSTVFCYAVDATVVEQAVEMSGCGAALILCDPRNYAAKDDPRVLPPSISMPDGHATFVHACQIGGSLPRHDPAGDDMGLLLYTSGTTGKPKGAMARHSALAFNGVALGHWCGLEEESRILAIAPLFHITGVVCHIAAAFAAGASMVLNFRFEAESVLGVIRATRPTYTICAITALNALMNAPGASREDFASFDRIYSGGAPIPPSLRAQFLERTGLLIHTSYGMTETAAPTHLCPRGIEAPVDLESGALAIGIPLFDTQAKVVGDDGQDAPVGTSGELCLKGPQVMMGYWNQPEQTQDALRDGWLHSGDIAVMDEAGWFYLVDRKKDVIIASGFKVWPREVEDVLYDHPAVREAAVIGVADDYRGETVKAYVSLRPGSETNADDLVAHCRDRLASYKAPRIIEIMDELPKTVTGKIQRNQLREERTTAPLA